MHNCIMAGFWSISVAGNVVLTSTVGENGRRFACDGELVTFTCQVVQSVSLQWESPLTTPIIFDFTSPQQSIPRRPFIITLTSIVGSGIMTNFTSILQVNASRTFARTNTIVMCLNQLRVSEESSFTVAGNWWIVYTYKHNLITHIDQEFCCIHSDLFWQEVALGNLSQFWSSNIWYWGCSKNH